MDPRIRIRIYTKMSWIRNTALNYLCLVQGVVGQGSYGIVKLAYNEEDDKNYAMKILR
jgi:hypothetical protein